MKTTSNWRQIVKTPQFDFCEGMKYKNLFAPYRRAIEYIKREYVPDLVLTCPFKPAKVYASTLHFSDKKDDWKDGRLDDINPETGLGIELPNGHYRGSFIISTPEDPSVYTAQWIIEMRHRMMTDKFK